MTYLFKVSEEYCRGCLMFEKESMQNDQRTIFSAVPFEFLTTLSFHETI